MVTRRLGSIALVFAAFGFVVAAPAAVNAQAQTSHFNGTFEIDQEFDPVCAGETVHCTGTVHFAVETTSAPSGRFHTKFISNPAGVTCVGLTTGNTYRFTGVNQEERNEPLASEDTFISNFNFVGIAQAPNSMVHTTLHTTVNANGTITATVTESHIECH
jgi:hypothetical protein